VTCVCLTRNRRQWLPKAIQCYREQTYPNKELLILADGENVRDLLPDDETIRLIELAGSPEIGEKRNFGCERAAGDLIAHWDDDDWSAPGRLADQVTRLLDSGKCVTGYRSMRFTDGTTSWKYTGTAHFALGTSLLYRKEWWKGHRFKALQIGEDNAFVSEALAVLITVDAGDLMWASVHKGNTSPRNLSKDGYRKLAA
jgi:glycosyltransferase involved in cell wall biosynthesis